MIDSFIKYIAAEKHYSPLTERVYFDDLCLFCSYISLEDYHLFDPATVDHKTIRGWIIAMKAEGREPSTINRRISTLRSFYKYLLREKVVSVDPTSKIVAMKKGQRLPSFIEKSKSDSILSRVTSISNDFTSERDSLIVLLFYATGIRLAELLTLSLEAIDLEYREMKIRGKGDKERIVPIAHIVLGKLRNYLDLRNQFATSSLLFISEKGDGISRSKVYNIVKSSLTELGVDGKKSPHVLRHTFATHLIGAGVGIESVKELLGHENLVTTQIYAHNTIEELKKSYKNAHPRDKKSNE